MKQCHNDAEQLVVIDSNPKQNEYICKFIQRAGFKTKSVYSIKQLVTFLQMEVMPSLQIHIYLMENVWIY